ncbi:DUF4238 domain-containing protein (plasmid) [Acidovorax sp. DW039]|uniref:hypothetical protein n=1 Tax=Acidovorax sp. DW039 TaxID=3095606 RepID=UPI0030937769|nr:DUF4238 domain-containing protein [Acidovorax sp. DW039]BEU98629.1 DUF4238 domain-containing protein [Acidovorax sp. DW039]
MTFEETQKGNPHRLVVKQHTFPRASIARFVGRDGRVCVSYTSSKKQFRLKPEDELFCAMRAWDERAEQGYMREIEDAFQSLAEAIIDGRVKHVGFFEKPIVNDFFALWNIRAHRKSQPIADQPIKGNITPERNLTKDQQELLEKHHIAFIRPDLTIPGRNLAGANIQTNLAIVRDQLTDARWGILKAGEGEFIVPDNFSNVRIVPLTPTICLVSQSDNDILSLDEVAEINRYAIASRKKYVFARDFSKCPL